MDADASGQVVATAAEIYEDFFLPALFAQWAPRLADAVELAAGHRVLDVACGTGIVARHCAARVGTTGQTVGLDINPGMLAVARAKSAEVEWRQGRAEALPFDDASFDRVLSQFGLMFFEDRAAALGEMWRVLRPGGRLGVAVWASLDETPGYAAAAALLHDLFGAEAAASLRSPYVLGDADALAELFRAAGVEGATVRRVAGAATFASIDDWMFTDVKGWTLADRIDDAGFERLLTAARARLAVFVQADGTVRFDAPALVVTARKAG